MTKISKRGKKKGLRRGGGKERFVYALFLDHLPFQIHPLLTKEAEILK